MNIPRVLREQIKELRDDIPERPAEAQFLKTPSLKEHEDFLKQLTASNSLGDYDVVFTTYNQLSPLQSGKSVRDAFGYMQKQDVKLAPRHEFLNTIVDGNSMLILDEAHNAGRAGDPDKDQIKLGDLVRNLIDKAGGVFYSSATFAKDPKVMDAYRRTDLGKAFQTAEQLVDAMSTVPMQQATSAMLVDAGQYLRRERSFEGITYTNETVDVDKEAAEDLSTAMRLIVEFDQAKKGALADLQSDLDAEGAAFGDDTSATAQVEAVNFTSVMHNVLNTFLLAVKAENTADVAIEAIRRGEKPVITVANTLETFISEYARENNIGIGSKIDATFGDILQRYLRNVRTVNIKHGDGRLEKHYITDDELGEAGLEAYDEAEAFIREMSRTLDIPISPIDAIKQRIQKAGYSIGEITGRGTVVVDGVYKKRDKTELKTAGKKNTIAKFNEGQLDALIINRSGSTGLSMHASEKFADQRRRVMIIAQAELDINNHMQMLGRINRTGQVTVDGKAPKGVPAVFGLPYYVQLSADVPIELDRKSTRLNSSHRT